MSISLQTCKIDQAYADKLQSDRFQNPSQMVCPPWSGSDVYGRRVCPYSWWTKAEGCRSADDRVAVENQLRPQYMEYVTLDARGIQGGPGVTNA